MFFLVKSPLSEGRKRVPWESRREYFSGDDQEKARWHEFDRGTYFKTVSYTHLDVYKRQALAMVVLPAPVSPTRPNVLPLSS